MTNLQVAVVRGCVFLAVCLVVVGLAAEVTAQLTDVTQTPNAENAGIRKSLVQQVGAGRGDANTPGSSVYVIQRDPFRSIARGRQIFQRKFTAAQGIGPRTNDGGGPIDADGSHGAGLADSCAGCHGRPQGSAGAGGNVFTRPDSRDAPHLFGIGLIEMLADEITSDLRGIRDQAVALAQQSGTPVTRPLVGKGISYGAVVGLPDGTANTAGVMGVDPDLRVKPFFAEGSVFSIRDFAVGALNAEMGLESFDPDLAAAAGGGLVTTPSGMVFDGMRDSFASPPVGSPSEDFDLDGVADEIPAALVDHLEFYLLNYFKPAAYRRTTSAEKGRDLLATIGCTSCHVPDLRIDVDRRVADVTTGYDPNNAVFNGLFATATPLFQSIPDSSGHPARKVPIGASFLVEDVFTDLKRHDLGPAFWERNFDGSITKKFMTEPLWGVGSTGPYGHDGRSITLREVILRHGGEASASRNAFANLNENKQTWVLEFLGSLVLFPPASTASNLDPGNPSNPSFPQRGHGSIDLSVLFNDPGDPE